MRAVFLLVLLGVLPAQAQTADSTRRQVFVDAGSFVGEVAQRPDGTTERVERLSRGVRVRQDSTTLTSQRAVRYLDRNVIVFDGGVRVVERGDTLRSATLRYDTSTKIGDASGNVRLTDGEVVVTSPSARYDTNAKRSNFDQGVQLVDSSAVLTAKTGTYDSNARRAIFADSVRLVDGLSRVAADTLVYLRDVRQSDARGDVRVRRYEPAGVTDSLFALRPESLTELPDTLGSATWLWGARVQSDEEAGTVAVQGDPLMVRIRASIDGPSDTLVVRAQTLDLLDADSLQTLTANGDVQIWTPDYSALSDSAFTRRTPATDTSPSRERVDLLRAPIAWFDDAQLTGDTLRFHASDGALDSLHARGSGFVAQPDSASERLHQLSAADRPPDRSARLRLHGRRPPASPRDPLSRRRRRRTRRCSSGVGRFGTDHVAERAGAARPHGSRRGHAVRRTPRATVAPSRRLELATRPPSPRPQSARRFGPCPPPTRGAFGIRSPDASTCLTARANAAGFRRSRLRTSRHDDDWLATRFIPHSVIPAQEGIHNSDDVSSCGFPPARE